MEGDEGLALNCFGTVHEGSREGEKKKRRGERPTQAALSNCWVHMRDRGSIMDSEAETLHAPCSQPEITSNQETTHTWEHSLLTIDAENRRSRGRKAADSVYVECSRYTDNTYYLPASRRSTRSHFFQLEKRSIERAGWRFRLWSTTCSLPKTMSLQIFMHNSNFFLFRQLLESGSRSGAFRLKI